MNGKYLVLLSIPLANCAGGMGNNNSFRQIAPATMALAVSSCTTTAEQAGWTPFEPLDHGNSSLGTVENFMGTRKELTVNIYFLKHEAFVRLPRDMNTWPIDTTEYVSRVKFDGFEVEKDGDFRDPISGAEVDRLIDDALHRCGPENQTSSANDVYRLGPTRIVLMSGSSTPSSSRHPGLS